MSVCRVSIVVPCYNEQDTIEELLRRVHSADSGTFEKEVIVIDDCSTDGTREILQKRTTERLVCMLHNHGKGHAIQKGIEHATGDIILIQDADLEYHPDNYQALLTPFVHGQVQVVYGSRQSSRRHHEHSSMLFYWGGIAITGLTNMLFGSTLTDQSTGHKVFRADVLKTCTLHERRFGFCSEVTAQVLLKGIPIVEVPITYTPRRKKDGKKLSIRDGVRAAYVLVKYWVRGLLGMHKG